MLNLRQHFERYPQQLSVAELFLEHGISVHDNAAYVGRIKQSESALARAANVDRRIVRSTIEKIEATPELYKLFSRLNSTAVIAGAAQVVGYTAIEVIPTDDNRPGLLAKVLNVISQTEFNIIQAAVTRTQSGVPSHLILTIDGVLDGETLSQIRTVNGVEKVVLL